MRRFQIKFGAAAAAATVGLFALCAVPEANAFAVPDAYQIFDRARHVLETQVYPDPILYRTTVHVSEGTRDEFEHFRAEAFSSNDVRIEGVSQEEQAAPHESRGLNFKLAFSIGWNTGAGGQTETATADAHRKEASPDYLGLPLVSPTYSFGLTSDRDKAREAGSPQASSIPTIATVTAIARAYTVSLLGTEIVDGFYTYHLRLSPTVYPDRYRIRAMWIDAYTYQVVQLQTQGNFTTAPEADVPWLITFQNVDGGSYIKNETALAPLIFRHDRTLSTASITFEDIHVADTGPPILPTMESAADANLHEPQR
jgi:hypothetical protein